MRECFPRNKGSEGNFTCNFLIFRVKTYFGETTSRGREGRGNYAEKREIL